MISVFLFCLMNLSDLSNYVTTKSQLIESDDVAACQLFLSKRYELIYNSFMWKDSLGMVNVPFNPATNLDNANGVLMLPQQVDRLVAVRSNDASVRIQGLEHYYRIDWDAFCPTGVSTFGFCPNEVALLNPVWLTIRPNGKGVPPGFLKNAQVPAAGNYGLVLGQYVFAVFVTIGQQYVVIPGPNEDSVEISFGHPIPLTPGTPFVFTAGSSEIIFLSSQPQPFTGALFQINGQNQNQSYPGATLTITSDAQADVAGQAAIQIKVTWRDSTDRYTVTGPLPMTLTPADGLGQIELESVFKPVSAGNLTVTSNSVYGGFNFSQLVGSLPPTCTKSPSFQRIRIFPIPAGATTLNVLGKKPFTPLTFPTEVPAIRNLDNCLIAFAMGDMLKRARQFGKAETEYGEATKLLDELAKLETIQAANYAQFIPEGGYGDRYFGPGTQGYFAGEY